MKSARSRVRATGRFHRCGKAPQATRGSSGSAVPGKPVVGSYWLVPQSLYGQIRQDAVLLKTGEKNDAARALLAYLKSAPAKAVIESYGYGQ